MQSFFNRFNSASWRRPSSAPQPASTDDVQDGRQQTVALITAQSTETPLQAFENLARGNRRVGTLAAILSAAADQSRSNLSAARDKGMPWLRDSELPDGFVTTGIPSVFRQEHGSFIAEPTFKLRRNQNISRERRRLQTDRSDIATNQSKTEMLVTTLLEALDGSDASLSPIFKVAANNSNSRPKAGNSPEIPACEHASVVGAIDKCLRNVGVAPARESRLPAENNLAESNRIHDLAMLVAERGDLDQASFVHGLAHTSGEAAQFFNYLDHALLIKDAYREEAIKRYEYADDFAAVGALLEAKDEPWLETFINGVERIVSPKPGSDGEWRLRVGDQWQYLDSRREVLDHVFFTALEHLSRTVPIDATMPIYPLIAYELLADATGQQVPNYLIEHETNILATLAENVRKKTDRHALQAAVSIQAQVEKKAALASLQERMRKNNVSSVVQLHYCNENFNRDALTTHSVDRLIPLHPVRKNPARLRESICAALESTHDRQAIGYTDHEMSRRDNLCWLRAGWLSVLHATTPAQIASRLDAISGSRRGGNADAATLAELVTAFKCDPAAFMHAEHSGLEMSDGLSLPARLGSSQPTIPTRGLDIRGAADRPKRLISPEAWLKDLQCDLAAGFRFENDKIMGEIEALAFPGTFASSDMLTCLHRAFHLPALIIECDKGLHSQAGTHFRVVAPKGSDLATLLDAPANESTEQALHRAVQVFNQFSHKPVIWLEREHFEVYFPKVSVEQGGGTR